MSNNKKKKCSRCKKIKSYSCFYDNKTRGGCKKRSMCKECDILCRNKRKKLTTEDNRTFIWDYKSQNPCIDCGETNPIVLQFDHISGVKKTNISNMISRKGINAILKEINKCVVRCANCHIKKTAKDYGWYKKQIQEEGHTVKSWYNETKT